MNYFCYHKKVRYNIQQIYFVFECDKCEPLLSMFLLYGIPTCVDVNAEGLHGIFTTDAVCEVAIQA